MVRCSTTSAINTKSTITKLVKDSPIANAARMAMVIESSIVIFRRLSDDRASRKMG